MSACMNVRSPELFDDLSPVLELAQSPGRSPGSPRSPLPAFASQELSQLFHIAQELRSEIFSYLSLREISFMTRLDRHTRDSRELIFSEYATETPHIIGNIFCKALGYEIRTGSFPRWWDLHLYVSAIGTRAQHLDLTELDSTVSQAAQAGRLQPRFAYRVLDRIVSSCPNLRSFDLGHALFEACDGVAVLTKVAKFNQLSRLVLRNFDLSAKAVSQLAKMAHLRWLIIDSPCIRMQSFMPLSRLISLQGLKLKGDNICLSDQKMEFLTPLDNLRFLALRDRRITANGLDHIVPLSKLLGLDFSGCNSFDNEALGKVAVFKGLTHLGLACTKIDDKGLRIIAGEFPKLKNLSLYALERVTNEGVAALCSLQELHTLNLSGCHKVTAAGLRAFLAHPALSLIDVSRCNAISHQQATAIANETEITIIKPTVSPPPTHIPTIPSLLKEPFECQFSPTA